MKLWLADFKPDSESISINIFIYSLTIEIQDKCSKYQQYPPVKYY